MLACPVKMKDKGVFYSQRGQVLPIVALTLAVILLVVLSIIARSITDVAITTSEEESIRAFSAAEAGVEKALVIGENIVGEEFEGAEINTTVSQLGKGATAFNYPVDLKSGDAAIIWFVAHDEETREIICDNVDNICYTADYDNTASDIQICWGLEGESDIPAIEVAVYYTTAAGDIGTLQVARQAFDHSASSRQNGFASPDTGTCSIEGVNYAYRKGLRFVNDFDIVDPYTANKLQFASIKFLYNSKQQPVGITSVTPLPAQGIRAESTGTFNGQNRELDASGGFPIFPSIFEAGVFTQGALSH